MPSTLGINVGTTAVEAIICDDAHRIVSSGGRGYDLISQPGGRVEQDAEELWRATVAAAREALKGAAGDEVKAVSLSTQGGTLILTDAQGVPVRNAISWLDQRAVEQAAQMVRKLGHEFFYHKTGLRLFGGLPFLQLLWLQKNEPDTYAKAARFLTVTDFLNLRLTGRAAVDPSNAALSTLFDVVKREWSKDLLSVAGASRERLAEVVESGMPIGTLTKKAAKELGLSTGVVVVSGGLDQCCAAFGAGAFDIDDCLLSCGTAWSLFFTVDRLLFDLAKRLFPGPHVLPDRLGLMTSIPAAGAVLEWFKDNFGTPAEDFFARCDDAASSLPPGSGNLLFFPHFLGATRPTARGAIVGLTLSHDDSAVYRSIMEGIAFEAAWRIQEITSLGARTSRLKMIGGGARSRLWPQIVSDVTGLPVGLPGRSENAALGAALLAAVGVGVFSSPKEAYSGFASREELISPDGESRRRYADLYELYRKTFEAIQAPLKSLAASKL